MNTKTEIIKFIEEAFKANSLAVLATEAKGQPHASLVAVTPTEDFTHLIFATYRNTRKYKNLVDNGRVAILFENRIINNHNQKKSTALTAYGYAKEVNKEDYQLTLETHVMKNPSQDNFILSKDSSFFLVKVDSYQLVFGIDEIKWWKITT